MRGVIREMCSHTDAAGIVLTTVCDQVRHAADLLRRRVETPVFLMTVPATWQDPAPQALYLSELKRLGRFLVEHGGTTPSDVRLAEFMLEYEKRRSEWRGILSKCGSKACSEHMAAFLASRDLPDASPSQERQAGIRIALLGGPLHLDAFDLFDMIEKYGGTVVLDATETGERTLPGPFHRTDDFHAPPLEDLARTYFETIPDAFRRPNNRLYEWMRNAISERGIQGIVLVRHLWCDTWHAELARCSDELAVPVLDFELGEGHTDLGRAVRIQAFLEVLR
jgi:benzoyl-CoA reductase/2-hydroxyglutaryl-CoA dehydratase subunit BcrC/BadD/HgdB